tara:strand:- start:437 stop:928 length:492 start_codon:yes stop_codon:yes gene_type:complete
MIIKQKNKDTLIVDEFTFKCSIGKKGKIKHKIEGDKCTPKGKFNIGTLYYRADRVPKPITKLKIKIIEKNMGWCTDPKSNFYNKVIKINKKLKHEKLFRKDFKYNYIIVIEYNTHKIIPNKGSAIFLHLTKNYKPTIGCIALKERDLLILLKIINKKTKIHII